MREAVRRDPAAARRPRAVCEAAGLVFLGALKLLVRNGADLNASWGGYRPLHNLIQGEAREGDGKSLAARLRCLDWMLERGADPELTGGWPPARAVILAAFAGRPEFVKRLRRSGDGFAAAALANRRLVAAVVRKLPDCARARDTGGLTALQCAAGSRMPGPLAEVARLLIDAGADVGARTRSWGHGVDAVHLAALANNTDMFKLLLDSGADPTGALAAALWHGREDLAAAALARGAVPDAAFAEGTPLLNNLIRWGAFRQALWLLEHGASPNIADERGWTAVHQAASRGNKRMLDALLAAGGDTARRDRDGCLPLDGAAHGSIRAMLAPGAAAGRSSTSRPAPHVRPTGNNS